MASNFSATATASSVAQIRCADGPVPVTLLSARGMHSEMASRLKLTGQSSAPPNCSCPGPEAASSSLSNRPDAGAPASLRSCCTALCHASRRARPRSKWRTCTSAACSRLIFSARVSASWLAAALWWSTIVCSDSPPGSSCAVSPSSSMAASSVCARFGVRAKKMMMICIDCRVSLGAHHVLDSVDERTNTVGGRTLGGMLHLRCRYRQQGEGQAVRRVPRPVVRLHPRRKARCRRLGRARALRRRGRTGRAGRGGAPAGR